MSVYNQQICPFRKADVHCPEFALTLFSIGQAVTPLNAGSNWSLLIWQRIPSQK